MGKVEDLRAMREARYNADIARGAAARLARAGGKRTPLKKVQELVETIVENALAELDGLCGHRSMGNKKCTRLMGHSEKNHRYR